MDKSNILITGATGSLGQKLVERLAEDWIGKIIVYSRDEYKQSLMARKYSDISNLRFFLGDVRDKCRIKRCCHDVNTVIHAAALKQIPTLEYNPTEAVRTNMDGTLNVINACLDNGVENAVFISTDKAVNPINLYGATKMAAEKLWLAANAYNKTRFSAVRYGNVLNSRGSFVEILLAMKEQGKTEVPITDLEMTRFWLTLDEAVDLVIAAICRDDVIVPYIPSMRTSDLAKAIIPNCTFKEIGVRPGEKLHETLVSKDERKVKILRRNGGEIKLDEYRSDTNDWWMTKEELLKKLERKKDVQTDSNRNG